MDKKPNGKARMNTPRRSPVSDYTVRLLLLLSTKDPAGITVTKSQGFPEVPDFDLADIPTSDIYRRVSNRLKVLVGLTPMHYRSPMVGETAFAVEKCGYIAEVEFHDNAADPWLQLRCKPATFPPKDSLLSPRQHSPL